MIDKAVRAVDYLTHILQAIGRIDRYTADMSEHNFLASELTQDAVIRNFEIIGLQDTQLHPANWTHDGNAADHGSAVFRRHA
jgi:uncharacterized protein with HEPN domain